MTEGGRELRQGRMCEASQHCFIIDIAKYKTLPSQMDLSMRVLHQDQRPTGDLWDKYVSPQGVRVHLVYIFIICQKLFYVRGKLYLVLVKRVIYLVSMTGVVKYEYAAYGYIG